MDLLGFNSQPGIGVQAAVHFCFGEPVNHYPKPWLQGRCKYKVSDYYVGLILQATIRGVVVDFRPQQISKVFSFVVASRNVGFHIYNLRYLLAVTSMCCISICGVMTVLNGELNLQNIAWKKPISGQRSLAEERN
jgi:hypothetical protein